MRKITIYIFRIRCKFNVDVGYLLWGAGLSRLLVLVRYYW